MECQKIANLLDNIYQINHLNLEHWVEINNESKELYSSNSDIRFKTTILRSNLCDHADAYILVKGKITITGVEDDDAAK